MSVNALYTINTKRQTISTILGSTLLCDQYIDGTAVFFLSRGHLSAKADFVYGSQHRTTFRFVNVSPQWQTFNGGNWETLESSVRAYGDKKKLDLVVYTGTYGVATLSNVNGIATELYLYVDVSNNNAILVPKLFWKAVYDPKSQAGVVFVGINKPYVSDPQGDCFISNDVC
jgi:DNA/RNA endonuclease G (NUC1)